MLKPNKNSGLRDFFPSDEKGSALVACLLVLVVLTTLGVLAVQTSVTETKIATNEQRWVEDFNISEGGAGVEGASVGFAGAAGFTWYEISNPDLLDQILVPPTSDTYDPGDDIITGGSFPSDFNSLPTYDQKTSTTVWPHANLTQDNADNLFDYAYLVTYLGTSEKGLKGYDAATFAAYQFRINSAKQVVIELGGIKIGVKPL